MPRPEDFNVEQLIDSLRGTATNIEDHLPEGMEWEDLTDADHQAIDMEIIKCETCSWWVEVSDTADDETCNDCAESDDEEE